MDKMELRAKARAQTPQKGRTSFFFAAKMPHFCDHVHGGWGEYSTGTLLLEFPINTPEEQQRRGIFENQV